MTHIAYIQKRFSRKSRQESERSLLRKAAEGWDAIAREL